MLEVTGLEGTSGGNTGLSLVPSKWSQAWNTTGMDCQGFDSKKEAIAAVKENSLIKSKFL